MAEQIEDQPHHQHPVLRFYSHSQLFYYWPLWVSSLAFAAITAVTGKPFVVQGAADAVPVMMVARPGLGLAYLLVLISVIVFTTVNIRGVWAALTMALLVIVGLLFHVAHLWAPILKAIGNVQFYINLDFYLWTGVVTLVAWSVVVFVFDRRHYVEVRPTQLTVVEQVGEGEKNFDTVGLVFDKQRDNFFQHWLLGFGSGDLIITTAGGERDRIYFPNVTRISKRIARLVEIREQRGH